ncbi:MAG TPA: hypothetical protein VJP77_05845 [Planctomycetota bacterium]|nr:hypothetical protein [Planctomycetota bacterium]
MVSLNLDNEQLKQVVAGAVLSALSPESRESLIAEAVKGLLVMDEKNSGYYGERTSPLQRAFMGACEKIAREQCEVEMRKPENMARITAIASKGIEAALEKQAATIAANLGDVIVKALSGQLKERY